MSPAIAARHKGGGRWDQTVLAAIDGAGCALARIDAQDLTAELFAQEFFAKKPVVIAGLAAGPPAGPAWQARMRWQKAALLKTYGQRVVHVRQADSAVDRMKQNNGHGGSAQMTLAEYVHRVFDSSPVGGGVRLAEVPEVTYQFDRLFLQNAAPEMLSDFSIPPYLERAVLPNVKPPPLASLACLLPGPITCAAGQRLLKLALDRMWQQENPTGSTPQPTTKPLFFLGARGSGVGFHRHGETINAVVFGRKRWLLYPPEARASILGVDPDLSLDG